MNERKFYLRSRSEKEHHDQCMGKAHFGPIYHPITYTFYQSEDVMIGWVENKIRRAPFETLYKIRHGISSYRTNLENFDEMRKCAENMDRDLFAITVQADSRSSTSMMLIEMLRLVKLTWVMQE